MGRRKSRTPTATAFLQRLRARLISETPAQSPTPYKRQRAAQTLTIIFLGFISSPAPPRPSLAPSEAWLRPSEAWPRPQPRPPSPGSSGGGLQAAAAGSGPVYARALAVARGLGAHVPRAAGGAASAGGDGEACGRERREFGTRAGGCGPGDRGAGGKRRREDLQHQSTGAGLCGALGGWGPGLQCPGEMQSRCWGGEARVVH